ncbi:unnamed protein product [marine sediment metagenome]|uniref:Uncharacterized protein n=1 Tax=marine sediment metagenome TaxID=412755 RepID=X0RYU3_9ZZZZ
MDWKSNFDERELKEVEFCVLYKQQFSHGTNAHNLRVIVAKMASILSNAESVINQEPEQPLTARP